LETVIPNATESMLDLIRHFLFFNPSQRWTADRALHHRFFVEETQEPIHTVIETLPPFNHNQPVTPPIQPRIFAIRKEFTPFDLLETPTVPYQICPDWNTDQPSPVSSKDGNRRVASSHHPHHKDLFLNDVEAVDNNAWISKSRPIYSSHQKIHPGLDRPNSSTNSKIWSSELKRLATPTSDNGNAPSYTSNHESEGHHNEGAVCTLSISKSLDHISQYGNQVIKWSPPSPVYHSSTPMIRPESRRSRSSTRLLYSVSKDPHQPSVETSASSPSIFQDNKHWLTNNRRKTQKTMDNNGEIKKYQVAGRHRFNIWIPENDEDENDDQDDNDDDDEYQR
jgi:hypothetical protein